MCDILANNIISFKENVPQYIYIYSWTGLFKVNTYVSISFTLPLPVSVIISNDLTYLYGINNPDLFVWKCSFWFYTKG